MKAHIQELIDAALADLQREGAVPESLPAAIKIDRTRDTRHGDFACNVAMVLAKAVGAKPRELAERVAAALPASEQVVRVEIAGPGFINFFMSPAAFQAVVRAARLRLDVLGVCECWIAGLIAYRSAGRAFSRDL